MSRRQLMEEMDAEEVLNWLAYEMSIDPDTHKEYMKEIELKRAKAMSLTDEAHAIKRMLMSLGGSK